MKEAVKEFTSIRVCASFLMNLPNLRGLCVTCLKKTSYEFSEITLPGHFIIMEIVNFYIELCSSRGLKVTKCEKQRIYQLFFIENPLKSNKPTVHNNNF